MWNSLMQLVTLSSLVVLVAANLGCGDVTRDDGGRGLLTAGAAAPDFEAIAADGKAVRFQTTPGTRVVYFYPKDGTPGCTKEACAFRDSFQRYVERHITVFGISGDSAESHAKFRREHDLPFPLAADENGSIAKSYGVATRIGMPARVTFIVSAQGRVTHTFSDVDPGVHADQVLNAAQ